MNALQKFLVEADTSSITQKIELDGRLKGHVMTIKPLSGVEYNSLQMLCTEQSKGGVKNVNLKRFNEQIIIKCLVDPNLKDAEMIEAAKVATPEDLLYKVFLSGEIALLANQILELSGFGGEAKDFEEAKNC